MMGCNSVTARSTVDLARIRIQHSQRASSPCPCEIKYKIIVIQRIRWQHLFLLYITHSQEDTILTFFLVNFGLSWCKLTGTHRKFLASDGVGFATKGKDARFQTLWYKSVNIHGSHRYYLKMIATTEGAGRTWWWSLNCFPFGIESSMKIRYLPSCHL